MFTSDQSHHNHRLDHSHAHQISHHHQQQAHNNSSNNNNNNDQQFSIGHHFSGTQQQFSLGHHHDHQSQSSAQSSSVPQFLDTNQHLVAHFNQHSAALASGSFGEGLSVNDAGHFVSMIQQNSHHQDGNPFNPAMFFQHHNPDTASQHLNNHHSSNPNHQHHAHQHQQQPLSCANMITTSSNGVDNLSLPGVGHMIIDPLSNSLLRLHNRGDVVGTSDQAQAIVMNTINDLCQQQHHQQQQQPRATINNNNNSGHNNGSSTARNNNSVASSNFSASKLAANNHNNITSTSNHNNNNHTSINKNSKSKNNGNQSRKEKSESQRNSESPRRTFACPTCGKSFTEKFNMKRHMQIHSQSRPKYICNECSKSFAWKDNFIRHKKAAHGSNLQQYQVQ